MSAELAIRRAQVYGFLTDVFLYPSDNWSKDLPILRELLAAVAIDAFGLDAVTWDLDGLQTTYRHTFGATGSLCYETEYGLPHEYRMSHELADIAGFYHAFGFTTGGAVHERPDHVAVELEFMHVLALKEAYAIQENLGAELEVCREAQGSFLVDHLGKWIHLFAKSLEHQGLPPYPQLAALAVEVVRQDASRLGVRLAPLGIEKVQPTPFDPDFSCAGCACSDMPQRATGGPA